MPPEKFKTKGKKNNIPPLDETDIPAEDHGQEFSTSSSDSRTSDHSDILREIAESMKCFRIDFEKYKKDNDARAKAFEDKLDNISGFGYKSPPTNSNPPSQAGPSQDATAQDSDSSGPHAQNVTPMQGTPHAHFAQNHGQNFTRQKHFGSTGSTMPHGTSPHQNNFQPSQNNPFANTSHTSATHQSAFSTPFGTNPNPYAQNFTTPQNSTHTQHVPNTAPPVHPFAQPPPASAPGSAPPLQRNFRPNNFTPPSGIVIFDRSTWANSTKHSTCANENFETVHAWYDDIRGGMSAATGHKNVLPDLDQLSATYDFAQAILPPRVQSNYNWAKEEFNSMASALRVYFFRANTFSDKCRRILLARKTHSSLTCGFTLLLKILGAIFPHMGSMPYNINDKIAKLSFNANETYDSLFERFLDVQKEVEMSLHRVSNTSVVEKYMEMLMTIPDVVPRLSAIFAELKSHIKKLGPNVDFRMTLHEIFEHLVCSGITPSNEIKRLTSLPTGPQAFAAIVKNESTKLLPTQESRQVDKLVPRTNRCPVCYLRHDANRCWVRGLKWMPVWLRRNVAKYNALHPNDEPDKTVIDAPPPIRQATVKSYNPVTKQAVLTFSDTDQAVDVTNFEEFEDQFVDPEPTLSSSPMINDPDNKDEIPKPSETTESTSLPQVTPEEVNQMDNNSVDKLLRDCFHCGMADYQANPIGNPFDDMIVTDVTNPLVEY